MLISVAFLDRPSLCSIQCNIFSLSSSPDRVSTNISCNGLLPLVYHSRPQRLAFLMLCSAVDLCRCNKPRLPSQKTTTDANHLPCHSQKPVHCRKKPPQHCRKKNQHRPSQKKNQPTPRSKKNRYRRKNPKSLLQYVCSAFCSDPFFWKHIIHRKKSGLLAGKNLHVFVSGSLHVLWHIYPYCCLEAGRPFPCWNFHPVILRCEPKTLVHFSSTFPYVKQTVVQKKLQPFCAWVAPNHSKSFMLQRGFALVLMYVDVTFSHNETGNEIKWARQPLPVLKHWGLDNVWNFVCQLVTTMPGAGGQFERMVLHFLSLIPSLDLGFEWIWLWWGQSLDFSWVAV